MMIFRQLFDPVSSTYTYLLGDREAGEAVLIDPVFEQVLRDTALIAELKLKLTCTLETHVHADHVTGAWLLKEKLGSRICLSRHGGADGADRLLGEDDRITFGAHSLAVMETPGHTNGCLTYVLDDGAMAFTGDCLLIRGCGRTDFQQGSAHKMYDSIHKKILRLPDDCLLYPAHDYRGLTVTSVAEERGFNPRFGGQLSEDDFVRHMESLGLPHPKLIDVAVPANLKCGRREDGEVPTAEPDWAPLNFTFAGVWEIQPGALQERLAEVQVLDVREAAEYDGPLGHIEGAVLIPLGGLGEHLDRLDKERPVVAVCRAGGRSAHATNILVKNGFPRVANLGGGMLRWRAQNLPVEGGQD